MPSSRRSSQSSHSQTPPSTWRKSLSVAGKSVGTPSVSRVFAQSEQDNGLASAATRLTPAHVPLSSSPLRDEVDLSASTATITPDNVGNESIDTVIPRRQRAPSQRSTRSTRSTYSLRIPEVEPSNGVSKETIETVSLHNGKAGKERGWFLSVGRKSGEKARAVVADEAMVTETETALPPSRSEPQSMPTPSVPIPFPSSDANEEPPSVPAPPLQPRPIRRSLWFTSSTPTPMSPINDSTTTTTPSDVPSSTPATTSNTPTPRPAHKHADSTASIPSSIDEEVPSAPPSTVTSPDIHLSTPTLPEAELASNTHTSPASKYAVLNPSTSRFTLSIPLLGRAKVPLEEAVSQVEAVTTSSAHPPVPSTAEPTDQSTAKVTPPPPVEVIVSSPSTEDDKPQPPPASVTWSYWDYLGYKSVSDSQLALPSASESAPTSAQWEGHASPPPAGSDPQPTLLDAFAPEPEAEPPKAESTEPAEDKDATLRQTKSIPAVSVPPSWSYWDYIGLGTGREAGLNASQHPESLQATPSSASPTIQEERAINHGEVAPDSAQPSEPPQPSPSPPSPLPVKAKSLFMEDTRSWYSPFYYFSGSPTAVPEESNPSDTMTKTEAELVKEEALARDDPTAALSASTPRLDVSIPQGVADAISASIPVALENTNPIESSAGMHRTGWSSFFTSRPVRVKQVTEKGEGPSSEMEEMDLDEEGEALGRGRTSGPGSGGTTSPAPTLTSTAARNIPRAKAGIIKSPLSRSPAGRSPASQLSAVATSVAKAGDANEKGKSRTPSLPGTPADPSQDNTPNANSGNKSLKLPTGEKEKPKKGPPLPPLTESDSLRRQATHKRGTSPAPSKKSVPPSSPRPANLVLPTYDDTFRTAPRNIPLPSTPTKPSGALSKTLRIMSGVLFSDARLTAETPPPRAGAGVKGKGRADGRDIYTGKELPKAWDLVERPGKGVTVPPDVLRGGKRACVIGIHGWFPGAIVRTVLGEPTGTSVKFANMMVQALEEFQQEHDVVFEKITQMPLEGEGTIEQRVNKLYTALTTNEEWLEDLRHSDVIFVATHSQGSIVATHLLARLIADNHIRTIRTRDAMVASVATVIRGASGAVPTPMPVQRVCCLALCGIHLGPLTYLHSSSLVQPYLQYFESAAATQLFEFQDTKTKSSIEYMDAVRTCLDHGLKFVYVASLNDQVVPIYSGAFASISHPLILRALYIDGDAYHSSDFLSNLLVLLLRIRNAGLSDEGLLAHLSEATAGSLRDVGHSTAYEELANYSLAVKYAFLVNNGTEDGSSVIDEPFNARTARNDYEIPWALRELIADDRVFSLFSEEFRELRDSFDQWNPRTAVLKEIKRKLQPIQRLTFPETPTVSPSKL